LQDAEAVPVSVITKWNENGPFFIILTAEKNIKPSRVETFLSPGGKNLSTGARNLGVRNSKSHFLAKTQNIHAKCQWKSHGFVISSPDD
jgi:hypothetical protein